MSRAREGRFAVVGVGALNVDVIVRVGEGDDEVRRTLLGAGVDAGVDVEADSEARVDAEVMARLLDAVAALPRRVSLGGSAFNTVTGIASARPDVPTGYVGVAGVPPFGAPSFGERLAEHRSDTRALLSAPERAGVCLAVEHAGARNLRIAPGANDCMADHLVNAAAEIVAYLSRAAIVHVTSFLDDRTPEPLLAVLRELRRTAPDTRICLDPGHDWSTGGRPIVAELARASDYLLLNEREFAGLCGRGTSAFPTTTVIVKRPDGALLFTPGATGPTHVPHNPLRAEEIHHPTGAGDAFAAGLLTGLHDQGDDVAAVRVGLSAARAHLRGVTRPG